MAWTRLCFLSELREGEPKAFNVRGRDVVAVKLGPRIYAFDRWCTHEQGDLAMGTFEGTVVTCPDHGSQFDLSQKGKNVLGPDGEPAGTVADLATFDVRVVGGYVEIDL